MSGSILNDVKKVLGLEPDYTAFDADIVLFINSVLSTLHQIGIGPENGFSIEDATAQWVDLMGDDPRYNAVKTYIYLRVRMLFDPPATSFLINAMNDQIQEHETRLSYERERTDWSDPNGIIPEDVVIFDGGAP